MTSEANNSYVVGDTDPLKKREEFAVSLRKKKKAEILNVKREKRIKMVYDTQLAVENLIYSSCPLFSQ